MYPNSNMNLNSVSLDNCDDFDQLIHLLTPDDADETMGMNNSNSSITSSDGNGFGAQHSTTNNDNSASNNFANNFNSSNANNTTFSNQQFGTPHTPTYFASQTTQQNPFHSTAFSSPQQFTSNVNPSNTNYFNQNPLPQSAQTPAQIIQPPSVQQSQATMILNEITKLERQVAEALEQLIQKQRQISQTRRKEECQWLHQTEHNMKVRIEMAEEKLRELFATQLLTPREIQRVDTLKREFKFEYLQLGLLYNEVLLWVNGQQSNQSPLVFLMVERQPFPNVLSKKQTLRDDELIVRLLTASAVEVQSANAMRATMIIENHQARSGDQKMIENEIQLMDAQRRVKFPLCFIEGTRKNAVHLRFSMQVTVGQNNQQLSSVVESASSNPFVVMTNQKQWEACERTLLKHEAFEHQKLEISWIQFANALQRQFIRATKQDFVTPTRPLSEYDINYLHSKFGMRATIRQKEYDPFWNWYGKCLQVIRYQRHILQLWLSGLVYGFMERNDVNEALKNRKPGHFVMRFSERHAGQFGIAYVGSGGSSSSSCIKHYLVQPNDTAAAKFTLPDFCRVKPQFDTILQFSMSNGRPQFNPIPKDQAFEQYYSKRAGGDTSGSGYDPL